MNLLIATTAIAIMLLLLALALGAIGFLLVTAGMVVIQLRRATR